MSEIKEDFAKGHEKGTGGYWDLSTLFTYITIFLFGIFFFFPDEVKEGILIGWIISLFLIIPFAFLLHRLINSHDRMIKIMEKEWSF